MSEQLVKLYELAKDRDEKAFTPPQDASYFRVYLLTGGRPLLMRDKEGREKLVPVDATQSDFEQILDYRDGFYRLVMIDDSGKTVNGPTAYAEIGRGVFADQPRSEESDRMMRLCERITQASEHKDVLIADMNRGLMQTHVQLLQGAANLLEAANGTIRVANGIESLERHPPVIDVEALSECVNEVMDAHKPPPPPPQPPHWIVQLLNGPIGGFAIKLVTDIADAVKQAYTPKSGDDD